MDFTRLKMKASLQQVLQADRIDDLQKLGTFIEVKRCIETQLMLKLGVNGWVALFSKLSVLKTALLASKTSVHMAAHENTFREAKRKLSKSLGFQITAHNQAELDRLIQTCSLYVLGRTVVDPRKRFEEKKHRNFINSSKLEGIHIPSTDEKTSLEMILAKHRR
ncbi:YhfG family protein [Pseudomonas amygdali]|nr:YhfG family protein [Pseudomonas amygdali]